MCNQLTPGAKGCCSNCGTPDFGCFDTRCKYGSPSEKLAARIAAAERVARDYPPLSNTATKGSSTAIGYAFGATSMIGNTTSGPPSILAASSQQGGSGASSLIQVGESFRGQKGTPNVPATRSKATTPVASGRSTQVGSGVSTSGLPSDAGSVDQASSSMGSGAGNQPPTGFRKSKKDTEALTEDDEDQYVSSFAGKPAGKSSGRRKKGAGK